MVFAVVAALQVGTAPVARADGAPAGYDREVGAPCRIIAAGATVRRVQAVVGVTQDGVLGPGTCDAIKSFQCTKNLTVDGVVGPITWGVMNGDPVPPGTRVCANLTRQTLWVAKGGQRTYTATRMRSGDPRLPNSSTTPTGNFTIYWKDKDHVSSIFGSPMPYSMFFHRGQAIHGSTFTLPGSHGCINVTMDDARRVWNRAAVGTPVSIWGVRPL
jgi:hypothetical protein